MHWFHETFHQIVGMSGGDEGGILSVVDVYHTHSDVRGSKNTEQTKHLIIV